LPVVKIFIFIEQRRLHWARCSSMCAEFNFIWCDFE
jgi:hypothetical protein